MPQPIQFIFALHDHQPIGNFDGVFEQAYEDSYRLFLDLFEQFPHLRIALHTSGPLVEWLDNHHPEYLDRLAGHVATGRIEIIGGAFYEPILAMIPSRDRIGQIRSFTSWLKDRLGADVRGMWIPERVWEQSMASDLVAAGIEYTILDDSHFKNAGLDSEELTGYFLTEDEGHVLRVFPGSERLRYVIPFADVHESIDYLRGLAERHPGAVAVFADDGEKFGVWPETKLNVFDRGWLRQFFELLAANQDWIRITTPSEVIDHVPPVGKVYLPEGSYREMTEWVLPPQQLAAYEDARKELEPDPRWPKIARFVRGGFWRNFKVRYPETNEMYCRMMAVSRRLQDMADAGIDEDALRSARTELHRGQCNCPYWHGAFGGVYLPHLRNAIYNHLIAADNLLDQAAGRLQSDSTSSGATTTNRIAGSNGAAGHRNAAAGWVEAAGDDYDFDGRPEVQLAGDKLIAWIAPSRGGQIYELDIRSICHNLLATLSRRPEAYHRLVKAGPAGAGGSVIDANSPVKFKQAGLENHLQYDSYLRKSLLDHWYDDNISLDAVARGEAQERGDFLGLPFEAKLRRNPGRIQVLLTRSGNAWGIPIKITKGVTLQAGSNTLEFAYLLEGLPRDRAIHFSIEFNFAGMPSGADDRYFHAGGALANHHLGQLGARLDMTESAGLGLTDQWLGLDADLAFSRPTSIWTYPIETVSQSEGGFELVHQSVVVQPHWHVQGDADGRWSVTFQLALDTSLAENRRIEAPAVAVHG
ncbi:MAG TPA: alpha-amylase/4-alpha-glucanotransferase domain-containing protein [Pirellulales bacterium]|nr:alpha-amylase/4-alpha-glucanotransferase domain-containing protein [Pirellulales bacterium]